MTTLRMLGKTSNIAYSTIHCLPTRSFPTEDLAGSIYPPQTTIIRAINVEAYSSTTTGGKSERTCYLACLSLPTETSHVWGC